MSGNCVITTPYQDAVDFIEDGVNGFLVKNNPWMITDLIADLIFNRYDEAVAIGKRGREMALKKFIMERFQKEWKIIFETILGRTIE